MSQRAKHVAEPGWWQLYRGNCFKPVPAVTCVEVMEEFSESSGREPEKNDGTVNPNVPEALRGTGDPAVTVPRGLWSTNHNRRKKLVLHVDLNNTILISDAVTGQGTVAALDYFLTTVTWGRMSKGGKADLKKMTWWVFSVSHENAKNVCDTANYSPEQMSNDMLSISRKKYWYWNVIKPKCLAYVRLLHMPNGISAITQLNQRQKIVF